MLASGKENNVDMINEFIKAGADVNFCSDEYGTALIQAVKYLAISNVKALLDAGADVTKMNKYGSTALYEAECIEPKKII